MKANELRIGNTINLHRKPINISAGFIARYDFEEKNGFNLLVSAEPIPLTEDWLLKLGFIENPYDDRYELGSWYLNCDKTRGILDIWPDNIIGEFVYLQYVHQLQNLYFALTGTELIINKP
jgi:hypothetical protein